MSTTTTIEQENIAHEGNIWCKACLETKPSDQQSPDLRYCLGCYNFLINEATCLDPRSRPRWLPREDRESKNTPVNTNKVSEYPPTNLSTSKTTKTKRKPGPKATELPEDLINTLAARGMGSKTIAGELARQGIMVSYKTIQRRMNNKSPEDR